MINSTVKNPLSHRGVGMGLRVWWIIGKGPSTAVGVSPTLLCSCLQLTSPSRAPTHSALSRHPASFPSLISDAKLIARETLSSWLYFSSCVILSLSSFYDFSPRGKNRKSYFFPPSALQGVEQILNSMKWSCQGLKAFSGPNHLSVHSGGWMG